MLRAAVAIGVVALCAAAARAENVLCTVKSVDAKKRTIVVSVNGTEKTFALTKDTEVFTQQGSNVGTRQRVAGGLDAVKEGATVQLRILATKGEIELVSGIRLDPPGAPKKKKK